jgi:hypothetical protein
MQPEY